MIGVRLVQDGTETHRVPRRVNRPAIAAAVFTELLADRDRETVATLWEPLAAARAAKADRHVVADEPAATPRENGGPFGQTRSVLLGALGGRAPDAAAIRGDRAAPGDAVGPRGVTEALALANVGGHGAGARWCLRNRPPTQPCLA